MAFITTTQEGGNFSLSLADGGSLPVQANPALPGTGTVTSVTGTAPIVITGSPTATPNVTIAPATDATAGSLSAADKTKLDGIAPGAAVASVSGTAPIVITGSATAPNVTLTAATEAAAGSLSAADKTKLDGITPGAAVASVSASNGLASSGGTTPNITWAGLGDIGSTGLVDAISGPSPIVITPAVLQFAQVTVAPTFSQAQQANAAAPQPMAFACALPGAAATNATNGTPGGYVFTLPAPVTGGAEGFLQIQRTGDLSCWLGDYLGFGLSGFGMWIGSSAPTATNFLLLASPVAGIFEIGVPVAASGASLFEVVTGGSAAVHTFTSGTSAANGSGTCINGGVTGFGGGQGMCSMQRTTTEPTSVSGVNQTLFWNFTNGAFKWRSTPGWQGNLAALGAGTLNTQQPFVDTFSAVVRTVSSATPTAFTAYTCLFPALNTIGWINVRLKAKAATVGTGIAVGDGAFAEYRLGYKNVAGTVTLSTAGITLMGSVQTTAAALTATLTAAAAGGTVVFSVTTVALATIDSQIDCTIDVC